MPAFVCPSPIPRFPHLPNNRTRCRPKRSCAGPARHARHIVRASTDRASQPALILGLNQYSHDASVAVIDAATGTLLFAQSKERLTRRKHDAGPVGSLVRHALSYVAKRYNLANARAAAACVRLVVANNHHFRVLPFERRLRLQVALAYAPRAAASPWNLIGHPDRDLLSSHNADGEAGDLLAPYARKIELSHHVAHALSAVRDAPFARGLVIVMDGMGDSLDHWLRARAESDGGAFHTEIAGCDAFCTDAPQFRQFPPDVMTRPGMSFREAETVYIFEKDEHNSASVRFFRVFKRWTPENAPPELCNHSFEEMESVGAMYSRVSAIIFKNWNNCGKVMGLAPYGKPSQAPTSYRRFLDGNLFDGTLSVTRGQKEGLEHLNENFTSESQNLRAYYEQLAFDMQKDLEAVVGTFVSELLTQTGEKNVVFAGGVALNSTMNGILSELPIVRNLYVPPFPGDEGISIGCAHFGLNLYSAQASEADAPTKIDLTVPPMPYLGRDYSEKDIDEALHCFAPWVTVERCDVVTTVAQALADSNVVAWFSGRSEFGPRSLGHRSLLADPRQRSTADFLNATVKRREQFRPFAPAVLAECAGEWFHGCEDADISPFMSVTKRAKRADEIAAVTHVDGTARLQTVRRESDEELYRLIEKFGEITGVPMVLNTSFNMAGEPIVESPYDAVRTFLNAGGIELLAFPGCVVRRRKVEQLQMEDRIESACAEFRSEQLQDSEGLSVRVRVRYIPALGGHEEGEGEDEDEVEDEELEEGETGEGSEGEGESVDLIDSLQLEVLEFVHEVGGTTVGDVISGFSTSDDATEQQGLELVSSVPSEGGEEIPSIDDLLERLVDLYQKRLILSG